MPEFFKQLDKILAPDGQVLCDSSDICYVSEDEELLSKNNKAIMI